MSKLFKDLRAGFEDAIAYEKGKIKLRSFLIKIPEPKRHPSHATLRFLEIIDKVYIDPKCIKRIKEKK